jgi:hypothetical protein
VGWCLRIGQTTLVFCLKTSPYFSRPERGIPEDPVHQGFGARGSRSSHPGATTPRAVFLFRNDAEDEGSQATPSHSSNNSKRRGAGNIHPAQTGDIEPDDRIQTSSGPGTSAANPRIDHGDSTRIGPPKAKRGTVKPHHSLSVQKYSCSLMHGPVRTLLQNSI